MHSMEERVAAVYNEAIGMKIREGAPLASYSIDRKCLRKAAEATAGDNVEALICFFCPCIYPYRKREPAPAIRWYNIAEIFRQYNALEAENQSGVAEAEKQSQILEAEGKAEAMILQAKAQAESLTLIDKSLKQQKGVEAAQFVLAQRYIDAYKKLGRSSNTIVVNSEPENVKAAVAESLGFFKNINPEN